MRSGYTIQYNNMEKQDIKLARVTEQKQPFKLKKKRTKDTKNDTDDTEQHKQDDDKIKAATILHNNL